MKKVGKRMTFKPSKLTPGHNLLWESSRMMLPEHVAMLHNQRQKQQRKKKPILDMQAIEELEYKLQQLFYQKKEAAVTVFGEYANRVYTGRIEKIEPLTRMIKLVNHDEFIWISFDEILEIQGI